ncbi:hypothetical protein SLEP1_g31541 [Rubroshorea leprosula]|uniref:Uncharacterized protein n=1 Tax=Rubroshorea leprosula TaxID=152421 RepID=A0AAV5K8V2_9ROSI|nr:hypothetical protein SLEP1_g31541 [Rubroshorea leprosula]
MIWHLTCGGVFQKIVHPISAKAWKHFDRTYLDFASDPRNERLGLCTDGFSHLDMHQPYIHVGLYFLLSTTYLHQCV